MISYFMIMNNSIGSIREVRLRGRETRLPGNTQRTPHVLRKHHQASSFCGLITQLFPNISREQLADNFLHSIPSPSHDNPSH
ncbi:hypothetical protein EYC84_000443 [Monilinia fructicola]|uniref:Uncharacterized protein n=1 Tax=Monilinia fructicola TaxID=38448 RepID=A0A5M9JSP4_MONFR|nr:hypothetical protein EYC84_000443 [Monilinia fructicola]